MTPATVRVASCVPAHRVDRASKLAWLEGALDANACDLFVTPQEFFGGHVGMPDDMHVEREWLDGEIGGLAARRKVAIGVGAATKHASGFTTEDFLYYASDGRFLGSHRKFALPSYDDVRSKGAGKLWPETSYARRVEPVRIPELDLAIGTVFCWEVFAQTIFAAYSFAGVNLVVHPIKFAPRGWLKLENDGERRKVVGFSQSPKSELWNERLLHASKHQVMCPIAISCNTWAIGKKYMALTGHVDEVLGTTRLIDLPSVAETEHVHVFEMRPAYYRGIDSLHSAGAFKEATGSLDDYHAMVPLTMHAKMRRLEAQLIGGTTALDVVLKSATRGRQKTSTARRARKLAGGFAS